VARVFRRRPECLFFSGPIEETSELIVPSLTIYEVFKRVLQQRDEGDALAPWPSCNKEQSSISTYGSRLAAARLSLDTRLPMADSVVLATARQHDATVWTQDADFEQLSGVRYRPRKS
jgi:predicted nucleic acid-binding protein